MKMSMREILLAWITTVILVLGGTYWFGQSKVQDWKATIRERAALVDRRKIAERLLGNQTAINQRLALIRKQLPQHPADKDVTAELLRTLEKMAQENNLILLRREPEKEKNVGDLYEVAILCTWEGDLDAVVHFLYALQSQGAILDIHQMTISPGQSPGRLKGTFTMDCAYTREGSGLGSVKTEPVTAKK
jgi:Tfp pilus assembly protein PilO